MLSKKVCLLLLPLAALAACGQQVEDTDAGSSTVVTAEEVLASGDSVSFASDISELTSASRKVIRTADFRCRVNDVLQASSALEDVVRGVGGIVQESKMSNDNYTGRNIYYKPDSLKNVRAYTTISSLTLRVPGAHLDSVLRVIPELSEFVDSRSLAQNDVTLSYLSNSLRNKATNNTEKAMKLARKSGEAIDADEYSETKQVQNINRSLENLKLLDDANYATIKVEFYQPESIITTIIPNPDYFAKPSFGTQFSQSLLQGWEVVKAIFIFLLSVWPLLIVAGTGAWVYKKYFSKRRLVYKN